LSFQFLIFTDKTMTLKQAIFVLILGLPLLFLAACEENDNPYVDPSDALAIDSLVASQRSAGLWEQVTITAYTRGENIEFHWTANHGSMTGVDSSSVVYWGCPTCIGLNTIECIATNAHGSVQDTIMIFVKNEE